MPAIPVIGITMGDPAGIGPEIIVKALTKPGIREICRPLVFGAPESIEENLKRLSMDALVNKTSGPSPENNSAECINVYEAAAIKGGRIVPGRPETRGGRAMVEYILRAVELSKSGDIDAMVTCPISKILMRSAGYAYEGHTQIIADRTGTSQYVMMLAGKRLRVALATIHCPLRQVPYILTRDRLSMVIGVTARALAVDFGFRNPRLAVAGLNPHAGEEGLFGAEEEVVVRPSVEEAIQRGYDVSGPFPPDTVFHRAASGSFDAVVAMYHDQGLIPLKLLHFSDAVNITLGIPIVRTSVDHGTAYDIAGTGRADASSLVAAIELAVQVVKNRKRVQTL